MTAQIKVKTQRKALVKFKVLPKFSSSVIAGDGIIVTKDHGSFTIALDPNQAVFQPIDSDLTALAALSSTGFAVRTAVDTWAQRTLTAPAAGLTITNPAGIAGNPIFALANDLSAIEGLSSTGFAARTTTDTWAQRTITGTSNRLTVTDGDGVSGNPTLDISSSYVGQSSITTLGTIGTGVWQGTKIGLIYGGTNADLSATGGTSQVLKQTSAGGAITVGTLAASDIASGAALTRTNDTNVTLTLGGSASSALLAAASLTLGWTGNLAIARGGTGAATASAGFDALAPTTTRGDIIARGASSNARIAIGTSGYHLVSNGTDPAWTGFAQLGTGTVTRAWDVKVGEFLSLTDFGATSGGSTSTNNSAIASVEGASTPTIVFKPEGTFATTKSPFNTTDFTKVYYGPGIITDSNGYKRGNIITPITRVVTSRANVGDENYWFNGDNSQALWNIERNVNSPLIQTGSMTTNGSTASGNATLHFASVPSWVGYSANSGAPVFAGALEIKNTTNPSSIPAGTVVQSITGTTVVMSQNAAATINSGDTITFGRGQYFQVPEASPVNINVFAKSGTLNDSQISSGSHGQSFSAININLKNDAGGGSLGGIFVTANVARAFASFDVTNPFNNATAGLYGGTINANADHVYLNPFEIAMNDNGHPTMGLALVLDINRTTAGTIASDVWGGLLFNLGGTTSPIDYYIRGGGLVNYGIDFTSATFTASNRAAVVLPSNARIYFNGTSGTHTVSSVGTESIYYKSSDSSINIGIGGLDELWKLKSTGLTVGTSITVSNDIISTGGAFKSQGAQSSPTASSVVFDVSGGAGRILSLGANNATPGTLTVSMRSANESVINTAFSIATTGAVTFSQGVTLSSALTYGGVTLSNAVTGTGNMVLSASPTLTGTLTAAAANFSGAVSVSDETTITGTGGRSLTVVSTTTGSYNEGMLNLKRGDQANGYAQAHFYTGSTNNWTVGLRAGDSSLHFYDEGSSADRLSIDTSGNATLVGGTLTVAPSAGTTNATLTLNATNDPRVVFKRSGTEVSSIDNDSARTNVYSEAAKGHGVRLGNSADAWTAVSSDRRMDFKQDRVAISMIERVRKDRDAIQFYQYDKGRRIGFLAQDIYRVLPQAVVVGADDNDRIITDANDPAVWTYSNELMAPAALQLGAELLDEIEALRSEIAALRAKRH